MTTRGRKDSEHHIKNVFNATVYYVAKSGSNATWRYAFGKADLQAAVIDQTICQHLVENRNKVDEEKAAEIEIAVRDQSNSGMKSASSELQHRSLRRFVELPVSFLLKYTSDEKNHHCKN